MRCLAVERLVRAVLIYLLRHNTKNIHSSVLRPCFLPGLYSDVSASFHRALPFLCVDVVFVVLYYWQSWLLLIGNMQRLYGVRVFENPLAFKL